MAERNLEKLVKDSITHIFIRQEQQADRSSAMRTGYNEKPDGIADAQARNSTFAMLRSAAKTAAKISASLILGATLLATSPVNQNLDQTPIRGQEYAYVVKPFPTVTPDDLVIYVSYTPSVLAFGSYDTSGLYLRCLPVAANTVVLSYDSQQPSGAKPLREVWAFQNNVNEITSVADAQRIEAAIQKALPGIRLTQTSPSALAAGGAPYAKEMMETQRRRLEREVGAHKNGHGRARSPVAQR